MNTISKSVALLVSAATIGAAQRAPVKLPPRPVAPPAKPYAFPAYTVDTLPNGLTYAVVENHELPLVVVQTAFAGLGPAGFSLLDAPDKLGTWNTMLFMLREGTTTRTTAQIVDEAADLGTDLRLPPVLSSVPPWFRAARSTWKPSLALLADVIMNPAFPEASVPRVKTQLTSAYDRLPAATLANRIVLDRLYGGSGPYSQFATSATIGRITRDDIVAMQQKYLRPQNTIIVVAGDVTKAEAREALMQSFGAWARGGETVKPFTPPLPASATPTTIYLKDMPGAAQVYLAGSVLVADRSAPDAAAIEVMSSSLGAFSVGTISRIYTAFRIERGLAYSTGLDMMARPVKEMAPMTVTASVAPALIDTAVTTLVRVFKDLRQDKPVTEAEVELAKNNLAGTLPLGLESVDAVSNALVGALRDRLPASYLSDRMKRVSAVTLPEVRGAAAKYLDPDHLTVVVVGDRSKIEAALRATGIPVVIVP